MIDTTETKLYIAAYEQNSTGGKLLDDAYLSPAVFLFAKEMQAKLDVNNYKGDTYKGTSYSNLLQGLEKELAELWVALIDSDHEDTVREAADVANFAMFIALNSTRTHNG